MRKAARILTAAIILALPIGAQQMSAVFSWDLTYESVLQQNNVRKTELIWTWLALYKTPAEKWVTGWQGKPIVASVLIEHPAFHAAEHTTMWLIRTQDEAFYWETVKGSKAIGHEEPISVQLFDAFFKEAVSWKQLPPKKASELPDQAFPGYMGFLSIYGADGSRQMLITSDDFFICLNKSCTPGKSVRLGRLMTALMPILTPEAERNYKHKSEAEIAAMTPEQRIDEEINEDNYHRSVSDKQSELIRKYRRKDGLKGYSRIVELIDSYDPKRLKNYAYSTAVMMAMDIDDNVVRLRGSTEGKKVIEAIERLSARMKVAGERYVKPDEMDLPKLKGLNFVDHSIGDTLWVKYRIKISENELLDFSNFLISRDPTYPSWSEQDFIRDNSRPEGPSQFHVMRDPKRFHDMYVMFKKTGR